MEKVINNIGKKHVMQVVTDNGTQYKKAGKSLMIRRPHIFWTPCAAECIDLIHGRLEASKSEENSEDSPTSNKSIYNHKWVFALMRKYTRGDILRLVVTCFITYCIDLDSMIKKIACKPCSSVRSGCRANTSVMAWRGNMWTGW